MITNETPGVRKRQNSHNRTQCTRQAATAKPSQKEEPEQLALEQDCLVRLSAVNLPELEPRPLAKPEMGYIPTEESTMLYQTQIKPE